MTIAGSYLLQITPLKYRPPILAILEPEKIKSPVSIDRIYGLRDIFGLYVPPSFSPNKKNMASSMPTFNPPTPPSPPSPPKPQLQPPLNVGLNGIIFSPIPDKCIAMATDDTGKEKLFGLGDPIRDGVIIKIAHNRIVIMRSNGQQETVYLRRETLPMSSATPNALIEKHTETNFTIDPLAFSQVVESLGSFVQSLDLTPVYESGNFTGIRIGEIKPDSIGSTLGLKTKDVVISINDFALTDIKARIKAYETVTKLKKGDSVKVVCMRDGTKQELHYELNAIEKTAALMPGFELSNTQTKATEPVKNKSRTPTKEELMIDDSVDHSKQESYNDMISSMRDHLMGNMRTRSRSSRVQ